MLEGMERLEDLVGPQETGLVGASLSDIEDALMRGDVDRLEATDGHFAATVRDGQTVRMARTIGRPLRYFVAKRYHGPYLVVSDRIDGLYEYCLREGIGWQFDPQYTRMIPAHHVVEVDQVGCPDPNPRYHRFFNPEVAKGPNDVRELGKAYIGAAFQEVKNWIGQVPEGRPIAVLFSGGVDSGSILLLARRALEELGRDPDLARAFTLDLGGGEDAAQAERWMDEMGLRSCWERIDRPRVVPDLEEAISIIEDYHPLDVECAAATLVLLRGIRERYPDLTHLLDGDGGDENLKSYPLEDSDLTLSSILRNPLLYQEGWGIDAIKHSQCYSGGLSRSYARTYAPAQHLGFEPFSPYATRSAIAAAVSIPFEEMLQGSVERLYGLKSRVVREGVEAVVGVRMPVFPKRRFQEGVGGDPYRRWKVGKAWCRQVFFRQWEERLRTAWDPSAERVSGNALPA